MFRSSVDIWIWKSKVTFLPCSQIADLFWYFQCYYALRATAPSEATLAVAAGTYLLSSFFSFLFFFFFLQSPHRRFDSALNWISLGCTCQPEQSRGGQCGGLIRTEICTDCASVWHSPQEKDVKCPAEQQRLCGHFVAISALLHTP